MIKACTMKPHFAFGECHSYGEMEEVDNLFLCSYLKMTRCWGCIVLAVWAVIVLVRLVGSILHVVHPGGNTSYLVLWKVKFTNYPFALCTSNIHELIKVHKASVSTQKKCVSIRSKYIIKMQVNYQKVQLSCMTFLPCRRKWRVFTENFTCLRKKHLWLNRRLL